MEILQTMDVMLSLWMGVDQAAGKFSFLFPWVWILSCLGVRTFQGFGVFLEILWNLGFLGSAIPARGMAANWLLGGEKNYIVYNLFCIFMIIIIIVISSSICSSISFVLLNCLYLNPRVSHFVLFSSPSCWGGRGGVSEWLSGAELTAAGLNSDTDFWFFRLPGISLYEFFCLQCLICQWR